MFFCYNIYLYESWPEIKTGDNMTKEPKMRLQKFIALSGVASRRKAEEMILNGRVKVNGNVIRELGTKVDVNHDVVEVDGKKLTIKNEKIYIMLNKPVGYVTTVKDQFNRPTVISLIENEIKERVYPVGRLDYDTEGLLLLTNDGELTYRITHPKHNINKTYIAVIKGIPSETELNRFRSGLCIEDYTTSPAAIEIIKVLKNESVVKITIHEGKNRQIRKMCEAIGHPVKQLKRIAIGNIRLNDLPVGQWRYLTPQEIKYLKGI